MSRVNNLGKVAVGSSTLIKASKFSWDHDVNTTASFGSYQPTLCKMVPPKTHSVLKDETVVWVDGVNSPVWGKPKAKQHYYFVSVDDLSRNIASMLTQTSVARGGGDLLEAVQTPSVLHYYLSCLPLVGSRCKMFLQDVNDPTEKWKLFNKDSYDGEMIRGVSLYHTKVNNPIVDMFTTHVANSGNTLPDIDKYLTMEFDIIEALDRSGEAAYNSMNIQLFNPDFNSLFYKGGFDEFYTLDAADVWFECSGTFRVQYSVNVGAPDGTEAYDKTFKMILAFRLSDFGKRLNNVFNGGQLKLNLYSKDEISLMPLFAIYKAYYETNGILLHTNYEYTACARLLAFFDNVNEFDFTNALNLVANTTAPWSDVAPLMWEFIQDIGSLWATDGQDYISSLTEEPNVNPSFDRNGFLRRILLNDSAASPSNQSGAISGGFANGDYGDKTGQPNTPYVNTTYHDQVTSELLKRITRLINHETIAGKNVYELAKAQGLGNYIDHMKPAYIGCFETDIEISEIYSSADTLNEAGTSGADIGKRGGRGIGYSGAKHSLHYTSDSFGFVISLVAILPQGGYTQMREIAWDCKKKSDYYNKMFDALGFQAIRKRELFDGVNTYLLSDPNGTQNTPYQYRSAQDATFGFAPMLSRHKVCCNVMSGECVMRSARARWLTYSLDKIVDIGETSAPIEIVNDGKVDNVEATIGATFSPAALPHAGVLWRYGSRWTWMNNYDRIFNVRDWPEDLRTDHSYQASEFFSRNSDKFLIQSRRTYHAWAEMLPISDSYMTREDLNEGKIVANISKA